MVQNSNGNPFHIREVLIKDVPPMREPHGKWNNLASEVLLRLEQTSVKAALAIPFESQKETASAASKLGSAIRKKCGKGFVRINTGQMPDGWFVFVRRGPNHK